MRIIILFLLLSFIVSCRSTKKLYSGPPPERSKEELLSALLNRNFDFTWFSAKAGTQMTSPDENVSGSMQIRMKRDSVVWIAVKKFGIEAARLLIDKNQYTILYRLEGLYQIGDIRNLNEVFTISPDFEDLQQLMYGNVLIPDDNEVSIRKDSIYYVLEAKIEDLLIAYRINAYTLHLDRTDITDKMNRTASAIYNDYRMMPNGSMMSYERKLIFPYSANDVASLFLKFSEIEIDEPKEIKFNIPASYSQVH